jgi:hypothetical protein
MTGRPKRDDNYLAYRLLEDRTCPDYQKCLFNIAKRSFHNEYVPCYDCMGGRKLSQTFHCLKPSCQTAWVEENNDWAILRRAICPFCNTVYPVMISIKNGAIFGALLPHGVQCKDTATIG